MRHATHHRLGAPAGRALRALAWLSLLCGAAGALPSVLEAQQTGQASKGAAGPSSRAKPATMNPADSAACAQLVGYAFQHPEVLQKSEELQAGNQTKQLSALPDSIRARIAAKVAKGEADSLKALARVVDPKAGASYDGLIDLVTTFPDSVRAAVATLVASGRPMTCSPE
jgi:hypothetical protein